MSRDYRVYGKESSEKLQDKRDAYLACKKAKVTPPKELCDMFEGRLETEGPAIPIPFRERSTEGSQMFIVDLKKLPKEVDEIVFQISW